MTIISITYSRPGPDVTLKTTKLIALQLTGEEWYQVT